MTIRVVLVDDHPVVRSGLEALLATDAEIEVVGRAANGEDAMEAVEAAHPDVVLCDLRLGDGIDGVGVTEALQRLPIHPAVLILTTYDNDVDIVRAVMAGAAGYLLKDAQPEVIMEGIRDAAAGHLVLSGELEERMLARMRRGVPDLSDRERDVLVCVAEGLTNKDIARALFISEATVKTHLVHVFAKLEADSRTGAVSAARSLGLLP